MGEESIYCVCLLWPYSFVEMPGYDMGNLKVETSNGAGVVVGEDVAKLSCS